MYRINQVAQMLGVSTVDVHSQLVEQREELQHFIQKNSGVTYIDSEGVKALARFLEFRDQSDSLSGDDGLGTVDTISSSKSSQPDFNENRETELDEEMHIFLLRERISKLKSRITKLDQEIALKDEAIEHYLAALVAHKPESVP